MDSGNSGSVQSSSGGGSEEYDSRAESVSAFFNNNLSSHIGHGPLGNQPPPPPPTTTTRQQLQSHSSSGMFDPLSNYFDLPLSRSAQLATNPNSILNIDGVWSKNLRSEPNCNDLGGFLASSSPTQQVLSNQQAQSRATFPSMQIPQGPESGTKSSVSGTNVDQPNNNNNNMLRNSKKRSRASRRAPTTVLTTDTTNFRAMVQEFTGIPAPPFTSSPFPRARLDLFGTTSTLRSTQLEPSSPHYLLRPFAQRINPPSFTASSIVDAMASTPSTNNNNSTSSPTSINYQLPSELGLLKQPQNLLNLNMQNPILNLVSLLQAPPKYPLPSSTILGTASQGSGALEEFGLSQGHVDANLSGGLQNMVSSSSDGALPRNETSTNPPSWGDKGTGTSREHDQSALRSSINGGYNINTQRVSSNGKVNNFSVSSSDFHSDNKGPENVATRSEGMVESWICSSE